MKADLRFSAHPFAYPHGEHEGSIEIEVTAETDDATFVYTQLALDVKQARKLVKQMKSAIKAVEQRRFP